uniref:Putative cytochrome n=1 Tax=Ixodes scapularis TaxID=6945 RepID=A0A4D5RPE8_IXOSC
MIFQAFLAALSGLLFLYLLSCRRKTFSYFKSIGIPGPPPNLIWGNIREYHKNGFYKALNEWCQTYGDIFGFYNGDVPTLVVKDLDMLEYVFVRNFKNFTDRGITMRTDEMHPSLGKAIINAKESQWRTLRGYASSGFSAAKLKRMMPHISEQAEVLIDILGEVSDLGRELPTFETFQALAMDNVGRTFFGLNSTFQHNVQDAFIAKALNVIPQMMTGPFHFIAHCTTSFGRIVKPLAWLNKLLGTFALENFSRDIAKIVEQRRKNPSLRRNDVLQCLIDAEERPDDKTNKKSTNNVASKIKGNIKRLRKLTEEETTLQATIFFLGGFQTISISLCYATFLLAKHPDIQEKVRKEVREAVAKSGSLNYETVMHKLRYLGQVLNETLRMYPPSLTFMTRAAKNDFEYNGTKFKAGLTIMSPVLHVHMDSRYWPEPHKFNPDRFSPENIGNFHKMAFQPFGHGPRNCVGYMMAVLELRYTLARMVQSFRFDLGETQKLKFATADYTPVADYTSRKCSLRESLPHLNSRRGST